jgi:CDP-diacylglycerol--glycerol-3-phosphate 3-phosphatidyltransferase
MASTLLRRHAMFRWQDLLNLAGVLTVARLPLALGFVFAEPRVGFWLYATGLLTDLLDGEVARRFGQRSDAGAFADGLCDKLFHGTVALTVSLGWHLIPTWWLVAWFSREIL